MAGTTRAGIDNGGARARALGLVSCALGAMLLMPIVARGASVAGTAPAVAVRASSVLSAASGAPGSGISAAASATAGACPRASACVDVDLTRPVGPITHNAQGFLHGIDTTLANPAPALVSALHPQSWRVGDPSSTDNSSYYMSTANFAATTILLSDLWYQQHAIAPWQNWVNYGDWVGQQVQHDKTLIVDYYEVQNEPDGVFRDMPAPSAAQALHQYELAARTIRAEDHNAKIEGPSLTRFNTTPSRTLDLKTFIDYVGQRHLPLDALSWHEVDPWPDSVGSTADPTAVLGHVAEARRLLSAYPQLAHIPILITEYASAPNHLIPGWTVAWLSALEAAGVAQAGRSCWHDKDVFGQTVAECTEGGLDGLFVPGTSVPEGLYWVHEQYARMSGLRVASSSSDPKVTALAADDNGNVRILVGRHQSCTAGVRTDCKQSVAATPAPERVTVRVHLPAAVPGATLDVEQIPNEPGPDPTLVPVLQGSVQQGQWLSITLPQFVDGDAFSLTLTH